MGKTARCTWPIEAAANGCAREGAEDHLGGAAQLLADDLPDLGVGEGRHLVEQLEQLVAVGGGEEVEAQGQHLAQLDPGPPSCSSAARIRTGPPAAPARGRAGPAGRRPGSARPAPARPAASASAGCPRPPQRAPRTASRATPRPRLRSGGLVIQRDPPPAARLAGLFLPLPSLLHQEVKAPPRPGQEQAQGPLGGQLPLAHVALPAALGLRGGLLLLRQPRSPPGAARAPAGPRPPAPPGSGRPARPRAAAARARPTRRPRPRWGRAGPGRVPALPNPVRHLRGPGRSPAAPSSHPVNSTSTTSPAPTNGPRPSGGGATSGVPIRACLAWILPNSLPARP